MAQKITPYLWFNNNAEEAMNFYVSVFKNSRILNVSRYPEGAPGLAGTVMTATFQLEGQEFMVLNGGPEFKFNESISFLVDCKTQEEVDDLWAKLTADGGEESQCGWLKDKFGVSWQIIPQALSELLSDPDPVKAQSVMQAMLQMQKIDVAKLQAAYAQATP
jgi:predicted 3-demethylubiquinone-9 3-methyltransferase (glyoxalase superfamily)